MTLAGLAFAAFASSPSGAETDNCLTITSPHAGANVPARPTVSGRVCQPGARVWIVVQPQNYPTCWVQPEAKVDPVTGAWNATIYIGDENTRSGEPFRMIAFADQQSLLTIGKTACWPSADRRSPPVDVTKR